MPTQVDGGMVDRSRMHNRWWHDDRAPAYMAGRLKLRKEDERELRGWGGGTVDIPDYSLVTSRAGFVYRGGRLYNSVNRSLR